MRKINLEGKIRNIEKGSFYFLFTKELGIHQYLFERKEVVFINSFFDGAIKIPYYIEKHPFSKAKISSLKAKFNLNKVYIDNIGLLNQIIFTMLNEAVKNDTLIVETTGLANHSIEYFFDFVINFIINNPKKTLYIVHHSNINFENSLFIIDKNDCFSDLQNAYLKDKK